MAVNDKAKGDIHALTVQEVLNQSQDQTYQVLAIEGLGFDGINLQRLNASNLAIQLDYVGGTNPIYLGLASPGTATSSALWQVRKLTFDGNSNPTAIQYAGGSPSFNQIWDNRASLSYS